MDNIILKGIYSILNKIAGVQAQQNNNDITSKLDEVITAINNLKSTVESSNNKLDSIITNTTPESNVEPTE